LTIAQFNRKLASNLREISTLDRKKSIKFPIAGNNCIRNLPRKQVAWQPKFGDAWTAV